MPMNVFGNTSRKTENKLDVLSFVQKLVFRTNYIEMEVEEDIDLNNHNQFRKKIPVQSALENQLQSSMLVKKNSTIQR